MIFKTTNLALSGWAQPKSWFNFIESRLQSPGQVGVGAITSKFPETKRSKFV